MGVTGSGDGRGDVDVTVYTRARLPPPHDPTHQQKISKNEYINILICAYICHMSSSSVYNAI